MPIFISYSHQDKDFVEKHCVFATGPYDIGYGMRPTDKYAYEAEKDIQAKELEITLDKYEAIAQRRTEGEKVKQNNTKKPVKHWLIGFEDFKKALEPYTLDFVAELSKGDPDEDLDSFKAKLVQLADHYADPDRKVVSLEGDGSAMYTIQALWTMARENLDVTVVIYNNRKYSILELEFARTGARGGKPGPNAASMLDIGSPDMDFVAMAQGMGVSASRATTVEEFNTQLEAALAASGPHLIDAVVPTLLS